MVNNQIDFAVSLLRQDKIVAFPTDTVYGLGGDPRSEQAIRAVFSLKNRSYTRGLPILIPSIGHLSRWVDPAYLSNKIFDLASEFWPGGLTIVVKKAPQVSDLLTAGNDTIAIRIPNHKLTLELLKTFNSAIIATSANKSGMQSPSTYQQVQQIFNNNQVFIIDGGQCNLGIESTIVSVAASIKILRIGAISQSKLKKYL